MSQETSIGVVEELAREFRYTEVKVWFVPFPEIKVKWSRAFSSIELNVSDYLEDAPEDILTDIFRCILRRIRGESAEYPQSVRRYLSSKGFREAQVTKYLERHNTREAEDLKDISKALRESAIFPQGTRVVWGTVGTRRALRVSPMFRAVILDSALKEVDEIVLKRILAYAGMVIRDSPIPGLAIQYDLDELFGPEAADGIRTALDEVGLHI